MKSKKPSKQRKAFYEAPLHMKHKFLSANLSKELRNQFKRRSLALRKGDEVKVMRGKFRGAVGKISRIELKRLKVYVENVKRKKVSGEEVKIPIHPSKLMITNPVMDDAKRKEIIERVKK
jgi:large subunit ribosomal protein L24